MKTWLQRWGHLTWGCQDPSDNVTLLWFSSAEVNFTLT